MRATARRTIAAVAVTLTLGACATTTASYKKPGFYTEVRDNRLWVFREGSKELAEFKQHGEPAHQLTRVGAGPNGITIKSSDASVIDDYLAAK
jgi:hypothetical protein